MEIAFIVCNIENFDPIGMHTGDSIVVVLQTLTNRIIIHLEKFKKIANELNTIGECNSVCT